uniref:Enoyl reductase (ER) domain-containing protein n=1 Tax=Globisporangium ultimum (strain ATCC 200006 / CBS 805.95 / DAOM BR144) TaxID=431595 RepID=K3WKV6_GLOUD
MRAWFYTRYGGPAVLQTGEQPDAALQSTYDVVIKVHAASLNPIDYKRRQGALKVILDKHWPHVVGYDVSGVVVECGAEVMRFQVGDEVFGMLPHNRNGALAELASVHEDYLAKKPANLTHVQAASLPLVSLTALLSFRAGHLEEGKRVLVTGGAGGVGSIAIQIAKAVFKAQTVATTASTRKVERMKSLGADEVIDYTREAFERELAEYDFALDCTGESVKCFECVTKNGSVVSISETPSADELRGLESKGVQVSRFIGFVLNCLSHSVAKKARQVQIHYKYFFVVGNGAVLDEIRTLCEQHVVSPVIDKVYPFEKADTAMEYLEAGHAMGKVVVEMIPGAV